MYSLAAWTEVGPQDPFVEQAHGWANAPVADLLELTKLTANDVKEIIPALQSGRRRTDVVHRQEVEAEAAGKNDKRRETHEQGRTNDTLPSKSTPELFSSQALIYQRCCRGTED